MAAGRISGSGTCWPGVLSQHQGGVSGKTYSHPSHPPPPCTWAGGSEWGALGAQLWTLVSSFLRGLRSSGTSEHHVPFPASCLRDQRLAVGSTAVPPQGEGCHGQDHDEKDPSRESSTVVAPLGAGLLLQVNRRLVWEGKESQNQNEPTEFLLRLSGNEPS